MIKYLLQKNISKFTKMEIHNYTNHSSINRPLISVAPMIDVSTIYFRYFMRLITNQAAIYTEMIHYNAIFKNKQKEFQLLKFTPQEHPIILQLGGSDPKYLAQASKIAESMGYDEINLNVGCPSPKVQSGSFGACLMKQPDLVSKCLYQMSKSVKIPVTIKCRLGIDQEESYEFIRNFVEKINKDAKINHFIIHARNALLKGLNPAQNRTIPPLKYNYVYQLQKDFPEINFTINGGIKTIKQAHEILNTHNVYGCMIGRTAYENPWEFAKVDEMIYNKPGKNYSKKELLEQYAEWAQKYSEQNPTASRSIMVKPLLNLFVGERNNSKYKQFLSDYKIIQKYETIYEHIQDAIKIVQENKIQSLHQRKSQFKSM